MNTRVAIIGSEESERSRDCNKFRKSSQIACVLHSSSDQVVRTSVCRNNGVIIGRTNLGLGYF